MSDTVIVVPAYNEADALPSVLDDLARNLPEADVVVVDDGSEDATGSEAEAAGVTCIRLPYNMGIGGALRAGFRYANEYGYIRAVQFDADGQHIAEQVPLLLSALDDGAVLAIGNRFGEVPYHVGTVRRLAMALLRFGVWMACGRGFRDPSSGFRAVEQPLLGDFAADYPLEYMDSVEALVAVCRSGHEVAEVAVEMRERVDGVPSTGPVRLVHHYLRLIVAVLAGGLGALAVLSRVSPVLSRLRSRVDPMISRMK